MQERQKNSVWLTGVHRCEHSGLGTQWTSNYRGAPRTRKVHVQLSLLECAICKTRIWEALQRLAIEKGCTNEGAPWLVGIVSECFLHQNRNMRFSNASHRGDRQSTKKKQYY